MCMGTTITVSDDTLKRFNQLKEEHTESGVPEMNADLFLQSLMDTLEAAGNGYYSDPNAEAIAEELKNEISMVNEPTEVDTESIIGRIEDLEASLPRRVAEELRQ